MRPREYIAMLVLAAGVVLSPFPSLLAQEFSLQVGPPIAAAPQPAPGTTPEMKVTKAAFAVRPVGCADPGQVRISATAEGLDAGGRRTLPLVLAPATTPGVHLVSRNWPATGAWVIHLVGVCGGRTSGVLVALAPDGTYQREGVQPLAGSTGPEQIDRALRAMLARQPAAAPR